MLKKFFQERKLADTAQGNVNSAQTWRIWVRFREKKINTKISFQIQWRCSTSKDELYLFPIGQLQKEISYKDGFFYLRSTILDTSQSDSTRKKISQGMSSNPHLKLPKVLLSGPGIQINCLCQFKAYIHLPWREMLCLHVISWNKSNVSAKEAIKCWESIKAVVSENS